MDLTDGLTQPGTSRGKRKKPKTPKLFFEYKTGVQEKRQPQKKSSMETWIDNCQETNIEGKVSPSAKRPFSQLQPQAVVQPTRAPLAGMEERGCRVGAGALPGGPK